MSEISSKFKVKRGLNVEGDSTFAGNIDISGYLTIPTQDQSENSTKIATTAFVKVAISNLINNSPTALDTLNELATALGNDPNFATTITNQLSLKAPLASPVLTGNPTAPTPTAGDNSTKIATTAYVDGAFSAKAPLNSPAFTGTPTAPTATQGDNSTKLATTAYVDAGLSTKASTSAISNLAPTASPTFTGIPIAPTAVVDTNTTQLATTAYVLGQAGTATPTMDGTALVGSSFRFARQDHVHPTDTSRAPLASPALTGNPTAPTQAQGDNSTKLATTAYVDTGLASKASSANPTFTGDMTFSGGLSTSDYQTIPVPESARFVTQTSSITGAFKITLPVLYTSHMMKLTVRIFEYATSKSFDLHLAGYNYGATPTWNNISAYITGESSSKIPTVRFGNDGSKCCIWIGETTDVWEYPQLFVTDVQIGYTASSSAWLTAWSISAVTVFDTVKVSVTPTKFAGVNSPVFTGTPTAPTPSGGDNSTKIATTAFVTSAFSAGSYVRNDSTDSNVLLGLVSLNRDITVTTSWQDISINGTVLASGSYMVQLYANDAGVGGSYETYYTGVMSWYSANTNDTTADEILLHRAGHQSGNGMLYLRVVRTPTGQVGMKLQIAGDVNRSGVSTYNFKFRRMI